MKVRWGLERITIDEATGDDVIPAELFQIIKDDVVKGLHSLCQQIWKTQQWPQDKKNSDFTPIPKKGNAKECSNYCTIELVSYASKVMIKILQGRLQQYMNQNLPDVQAGFRKGRGTRDQIANVHWIIEKGKKLKLNNLWKILKEMGIPKLLTCIMRNLYPCQEATVRAGYGKMDWFKIGKKSIKAVYFPLASLNYMQSTWCKMPGWMNHKLESRLLGEI